MFEKNSDVPKKVKLPLEQLQVCIFCENSIWGLVHFTLFYTIASLCGVNWERRGGRAGMNRAGSVLWFDR